MALETYNATPRRLSRYLVSVLSFPDQYWGWYFPAMRTARHLLQSSKLDAVFSTAPPYTAHLIALGLNAKYQLPWIADFRDPWIDNESLLPCQALLLREAAVRMEAKCVTSADLVVCNTDWQKKRFWERYQNLPREKFATLTNGFDGVQPLPSLDLKKHKPLLCLHLGTIYEGRRIDTFCKSLSILVNEKKLDPNAVRILFLGGTDESSIASCREVASELMDSGMIEFRQRVDKQEARQCILDADLLLVFQGAYRAQIPLKFYEYLSTGKPIFAVAQPGALTDVIAETGAGVWAGENDLFEIGGKFLHALTLPAQPAEVIQQRWMERFHFHSLSRQLAKWIRDLVDGRSDVQQKRSPTT